MVWESVQANGPYMRVLRCVWGWCVGCWCVRLLILSSSLVLHIVSTGYFFSNEFFFFYNKVLVYLKQKKTANPLDFFYAWKLFFFLWREKKKMLLKFFLNVKKQIERHFVYMDTCHENEFFACVSFSVFFLLFYTLFRV